MAIGSHDLLTIFNAKGERKAELPLPSISQSIEVDGATFQVSYGRDANDLLTAIIAPNPTEPQDLHFTVLGKSIDTDKSAVVTLTFSNSLNSVKIDPGYIGEVQVNSQRLHHDSAGSPQMQQAPLMASSPAPTTTTRTRLAKAPQSLPTDLPSVSTSSAASTKAGQITGQAPFTSTATRGSSTVSVADSKKAPNQHPLYWSEPITPPSGVAPQCGADQMKLVEISGSVSVTVPGSDSHDGTLGMVLPSGSTISTPDGSSAAIFMGGVNSVRLMPDTEVQITQRVMKSSRKTVVALHKGTIFNRVGHHKGEMQDYQVESPEGIAVAKGTEFADSLAGGHHHVFVVKGIVAMIMHGIRTGTLIAIPGSVTSGAMPPATDGNQVLLAILTELQPFQPFLQKVIADINAGTATPAELGYYNALKQTFTMLVDDTTHPNPFNHSPIGLPQDYAYLNPLNLLPPSHEAAAQPFFTPSVTPTFSSDIPR